MTHAEENVSFRAHVAALALPALLPLINDTPGIGAAEFPVISAKMAVLCADALLKALEEIPE